MLRREKLKIGEEIFNGQITLREASILYGITEVKADYYCFLYSLYAEDRMLVFFWKVNHPILSMFK